MNAITGHEAYEGLFAVFRGFYAEGPQAGDWVYEGLIFEGEMPPLPEALESSGAATAATEEVMAESQESEDAAVEDQQESEAEAQAEDAGATTDEGDDELSGTAVHIDGLRTYVGGAEGEPHRYRLSMSDDRASGTYTETYEGVGHLYDSDSLRPSIVALDPVTLTNDEGSWAGLQSAAWDDEMGWRLTAWLSGEDAYEGLTLYLHAHRFPVYSTPEMEFDGIIFEGEPPVMLEAIALPVE